MTKIETLIKKLKEAKEELSKNVNLSYTPGEPNVAGAAQTAPMAAGVSLMRGDGDDMLAMSKKKTTKEKMSLLKNGQWKIHKNDKCLACDCDPCKCKDDKDNK